MRRIAAGGEVLAPGPHDAPMQVIDARDQGDFAVRLCEDRTAGAFTTASPAPPFGFGDLLDATVAAVGPPGTRLTWVDPAWYAEHGGTGQTAPLWTEGTIENVLAADPARAVAAGLTRAPAGADDRRHLGLAAAGAARAGHRAGARPPSRRRSSCADWQAER